MDGIWGKLGQSRAIQLTSSTPGAVISKADVRKQVWDFLEKYDLVNFPRPVHNRIPNFKGAATAGQLFASLPEFKKACVVKVNPDKPQEEVRYQVLDHKKTLLVPTPRLRSGLFNLIKSHGACTKQQLKMLASRQGIDNESKPLPLTFNSHIDLVILGCVAVDKQGHRIGKGEGYADLEYAMAAATGSVNDNTIVIATVHDCQLFDSLPEEIFGEHDVSIDIIITPTLIHRVVKRLPKPNKIIWEILSPEKFKRIPILKQMLEEERLSERRSKQSRENEYMTVLNKKNDGAGEHQSNGNDIRSDNSRYDRDKPRNKSIVTGHKRDGEGSGKYDRGSREPYRDSDRKYDGDKSNSRERNKRDHYKDTRRKYDGGRINSRERNGGDNKDSHRRYDGGRINSRERNGGDNKDSHRIYDGERSNSRERNSGDNKDSHRRYDVERSNSRERNSGDNKDSLKRYDGKRGDNRKMNSRDHQKDSGKKYVQEKPDGDRPYLYIGKIPKTARVRDLKDALIARDIKPAEILWKGFKAHAFLYFETTADADKHNNSLQGLKMGDNVLEIQKGYNFLPFFQT